MKSKSRNVAIVATAFLLTAPTCFSAADTAPVLNRTDEVEKSGSKADASGKVGLSLDRLKALKEKSGEGLRVEDFSAEERDILLGQTRAMFGPTKKFEELSQAELLMLLDRVSTQRNGGAVGRAPNEASRPAGATVGRPGPRDGFDPRPDRDRRGRGQSGPPGFVRRGGGGSPGGTSRPLQPFAPTPYPESGAFSAPFFQGIFEEEGNTDPEAAIRAYRTMIGRYDRQRRNVSIAIFRLGEIHRKAGDAENARKQYDRILKEFSDQEDLREQAEKALAEIAKKP